MFCFDIFRIFDISGATRTLLGRYSEGDVGRRSETPPKMRIRCPLENAADPGCRRCSRFLGGSVKMSRAGVEGFRNDRKRAEFFYSIFLIGISIKNFLSEIEHFCTP